MRILYVRLENVAGIKVGSGRDVLEIDLRNSTNRLVAIQGVNGSGKTALLSSLTPFSSVTSMDERSSIQYIIPGMDGYKEIQYEDNGDVYRLKHYYKASKDTHSVKSYFMKNDEELNPNGNVSSFNSLVEIHFGLTPEMMRLIRIGSNVSSFVSWTPGRRKEYIGRLISEIDIYLHLQKKISEDLRVVKALVQINIGSLKKLRVADISAEEKDLESETRRLNSLEDERIKSEGRLRELAKMISSNNIDELNREKAEAERSIAEFTRLENRVVQSGLDKMTVDELARERDHLSQEQMDLNSKKIGLKLAIDTASRTVSRMEANVAKFQSSHDIGAMMRSVSELRQQIDSTPDSVKRFDPLGTDLAHVSIVHSKLSAFNQIALSLYQLGTDAVRWYAKLRKDGVPIDMWIRDRSKERNGYDVEKLKHLFRNLFQEELLLEAPCSTEFRVCPYYRLSDILTDVKDKLEETLVSDEVIRSVEIISGSIDSILNDLDAVRGIRLPNHITAEWTDEKIVERLSNQYQLFPLSDLEEHMARMRAYEIFQSNIQRLRILEDQITAYSQSGIDQQLAEIKEQRSHIPELEEKCRAIQEPLNGVIEKKQSVETNLDLLRRYEESKKYQDGIRRQLQSAEKMLIPLVNARDSKAREELNLLRIGVDIKSSRSRIRELETTISEYRRLSDESVRLKKVAEDLSIINDTVSTRKGIPTFYMKQYMWKIQKVSNDLLSMIFDGTFRLDKFVITPDSFEVPYLKNGRRVQDIKYASQSEVALATMALSFALAESANSRYHIPLLDEIDAGLDDNNRSNLLRMLNSWIDRLGCEQVFFISHNLSQMSNVPMDCIRLSDVEFKSNMQHIVFDING